MARESSNKSMDIERRDSDMGNYVPYVMTVLEHELRQVIARFETRRGHYSPCLTNDKFSEGAWTTYTIAIHELQMILGEEV